jgi:hypothetical protein
MSARPSIVAPVLSSIRTWSPSKMPRAPGGPGYGSITVRGSCIEIVAR